MSIPLVNGNSFNLPLSTYKLLGMPTPEQEQRSAELKKDRFYALPREVECFIDRANVELPKGWHVEPWTINRAVTLFHRNEPVHVLDYESLEDGYIVEMLDYVVGLAASLSKET